MTDRWYYRKAHTRRLSTGRTVSVRGGWAVRGDRESKKGASFRRTCPICGALSHRPITGTSLPTRDPLDGFES